MPLLSGEQMVNGLVRDATGALALVPHDPADAATYQNTNGLLRDPDGRLVVTQ